MTPRRSPDDTRQALGLQRHAPIWVNLHGLVRRRVERVWALAEHLPDPARVAELHELRIQAKELRYDLEAFAECLPKRAEKSIKSFKRIQDLLGAVHDADVQAEQLLELLGSAARRQRQAVRPLQGHGAAHPELEETAAAMAHEAAEVPVVGLALALADLAVARRALHGELLALWRKLDQDDLRGQLTEAMASVMA